MSKEKRIIKSVSDIIHKFLKGDIYKITKHNIKELYNDPKNNISKEDYNELRKIERIIRNKKDVKIILRDPPLIEEIKEVLIEEEKKDLIEYEDLTLHFLM